MPIRTSRLILSVVLIGTLSPALSPAFAQTGTTTGPSPTPVVLAPITSAQRDRMSRSLVTVQTVTLLRDRGVLDEAQRERVATLELDLAAALAVRDAAVAGSSTQAQARLEQARAAFDAEVTTLVAANQGLLREIQALRDSLQVTLPTLTDEEVRLRQRFADGDRVGTRAIMEKLDADWDAAAQLSLERAQAELARTTNLQRAARKRDAAQRAAVGVSKGDAGVTSLQVLELWDQAAALDGTDFWTHIERARLAQTIGNLPRARAAADDSARAAREDWQRGVAQSELGDIAVLQGDLGTAGLAYRAVLRLYRSLVAASPHDKQLLRNLSVSLERNGAIAEARGDLVSASAAYDESLVTRRQLSAADPSSAKAQRDVSISLGSVGDVAVARGDLVGASAVYSEGLVISRRLLAADPSSAQAQRDVSIGLNNIGDVAVPGGDLVGASAAYSEGLVIARRLSAADPSSAEAQRDVSVSLEKIGNVANARGDLVGASAAHNEVLVIRRRLSAADPSSAEAQRDVSVSLNKIGDVAVARGDLAGASTAYSEGLVIGRRLSAANPSSAEAQRDVSVSLNKIGDVAVARGDLTGASAAYNEGLVIRSRLSAADPSSAEARRDVGVSLLRLVQVQGSTIRWAEVAAHWRAMKRDGVLAASDDGLLTAIEEKAAQEARGGMPASPRN